MFDSRYDWEAPLFSLVIGAIKFLKDTKYF
ncbi:hypothetical protein SAMN04488541_1009110 [Thermoflexibacter ruber]|uniref:Uncharacterized protein n=1 Tax=Thermoflexibacter ruber TaxID=1003 RepID=A0A1I2EDV8_9BACT|nr:hypothetical protein SAMN04488541_1009110 [Thermoflexibacter ruber]